MTAAAEQRFRGVVFQLPEGLGLESDTNESVPSPVPGAPPATESSRAYGDGAGRGLYLFHFEGVHARDRGPMAFAETWDVEVAGRTLRAGRTRVFFGRDQEVLVAHLGHPAPGHGRYLVYARGLDRPTFDLLLGSIRFEAVDRMPVTGRRLAIPEAPLPLVFFSELLSELERRDGEQTPSRLAVAKMMADEKLRVRLARGEPTWLLLFEFEELSAAVPTLQALSSVTDATGLYFPGPPAGLDVAREEVRGNVHLLFVRGGWRAP